MSSGRTPAEEGKAVELPVGWSGTNSPYFDGSVPGDNLNQGVRLNMAELEKAGILSGYPVGTSGGNAAIGGPESLHVTVMKFAKPPNLTIRTFWNLIYLNMREKKPGKPYFTFPFFTWQQYQTIWKWMSSIMSMDGDETYWYWIASANPKMMELEQMPKLAKMMNTFWYLGLVYIELVRRYGKSGIAELTEEEWKIQEYMKEITSVEGFRERIYEVCSTMSPPPHYVMPNHQYWEMVIGTWLNHQKNTKQPLKPNIIPYLLRTHPIIGTIVLVNTKVYSAFYNKLGQTNNTVEMMICDRYIQQWIHLLGEDAVKRYDHVALTKAWGNEIPKPKVGQIRVPKPKYTKKEIPARFYPGPNENQAKLLQSIEQAFGERTLEVNFKPELIMDAMDIYNTTGFPYPLHEKYNWTDIITRLKDPGQSDVVQFIFVGLVQNLYLISLLCKETSENWKLPYQKWIWNKDGMTVREVELLQAKQSPFSSEFVLKHWPSPWNLNDKEMNEYLDYLVPLPKFREKAILEDESEYNDACKASVSNYQTWRNKIFQTRKALETHPIGSAIEVNIDGKKETILNYYPDLGVWDYPETSSPWKRIAAGFLNPWKALTGHGLLDDLLGRVKKIFNALWPLLDRAVNTLTDQFNKIVIGVVAIGVVGIVGFREITSYQSQNQNKQK